MINVNKQNSNHRPLAKAKVVYEDINRRDQLIHQEMIQGVAGSAVDSNWYKRRIPQGYEFVGYGNFDQKLINGHINIIYVREDPNANVSPAKSMIKVDFVNRKNQLVGRHSFSGQLDKPFRSRDYRRVIPKGYRFNKILVGNNVTKFSGDTQIIVISLDKVRIKSKILIKYLDGDHQIDSTVAQSFAGKRFDIVPFKQKVPAHYHFVKTDGPVPKTFKPQQVTVKIQVMPDQSKQPKADANHSASQTAIKNLQRNQQEIKNSQNLGKILSKIGTSLNSLGKILQSQNRSKH